MPRRSIGAILLLLFLAAGVSSPSAAADKPVWPLTLRDGIPTAIPGWDAAPRDPLPDTGENEMGAYTEVSRFFQRIEPSTARQFRIAVQDYGKEKNLAGDIRRAMSEAGKTAGVETAALQIGGLDAYAVTDRTQGQPTTLVTIVVLPGRLVLGQGSNVDRDEAVKLLGRVDYAKIAAAK
ncbi:MAG TPA: hypothetical protein VEG84_01820 [Thermoanaerobaculia bacterium]|nr:hypothetical protein [Thermoanaerobaculia bacterium]